MARIVCLAVAKLAVMLVMLGMSKILSKNTFFQNIKLLLKILNIILKTLKIKRIRIIFNHFELLRNFALMQAIEHDNWVNMPACHALFRPA